MFSPYEECKTKKHLHRLRQRNNEDESDSSGPKGQRARRTKNTELSVHCTVNLNGRFWPDNTILGAKLN